MIGSAVLTTRDEDQEVEIKEALLAMSLKSNRGKVVGRSLGSCGCRKRRVCQASELIKQGVGPLQAGKWLHT